MITPIPTNTNTTKIFEILRVHGVSASTIVPWVVANLKYCASIAEGVIHDAREHPGVTIDQLTEFTTTYHNDLKKIIDDGEPVVDLSGYKNSYMFRAECMHDVSALLTNMDAKGLALSISIQNDPDWPDLDVTMKTNLTLDEVRAEMRTVPDGHVMVQTLVPEGEFTGERNYEL